MTLLDIRCSALNITHSNITAVVVEGGTTVRGKCDVGFTTPTGQVFDETCNTNRRWVDVTECSSKSASCSFIK